MAYSSTKEILVSKKVTVGAGGLAATNIFAVTGLVKVLMFYAILTRVGNDSTGVTFDWEFGEIGDGTSIRTVLGSMSGNPALSMAILNGDGDFNFFGGQTHGDDLDNPDIIIFQSLPGSVTHVYFTATGGDANTDFDIKTYIRYIPLSLGSKIVSV